MSHSPLDGRSTPACLGNTAITTSAGSNRMLGASVTKRIIVGTYSFTKGLDANGTATSFQWTCLVRSGESDAEDISEYIRRVEFNLHSTFAHPRRVVETVPLQVEEQGWGEFEIHIKIYFQDTNERPLEMKHWLKLRPDNGETVPGTDYMKVPVVSETYEEILFQSPHEWFYQKLTKPPNTSSSISILSSPKISAHPLFRFMRPPERFKAEETENSKKLLELEQFLRNQISSHQSQIMMVDSDYRAYRDHFFKYNIPE